MDLKKDCEAFFQMLFVCAAQPRGPRSSAPSPDGLKSPYSMVPLASVRRHLCPTGHVQQTPAQQIGLREEGIAADFPSSHETRMVLESSSFPGFGASASVRSFRGFSQPHARSRGLKAWFKPEPPCAPPRTHTHSKVGKTILPGFCL